MRTVKRSGHGLALLLALAALLGMARCGSLILGRVSGAVTTTVSDPPTCSPPQGGFRHVWITVVGVRAHIESSAAPEASGWQDLTPGLALAPRQVDLLAAPSGCVLTVLGSTTGLPPGRYQQIRFLLLSNNPPLGTPVPPLNNCGVEGFNCVELADGSIEELELSSEAQTGIKVPPGRIAGGAIVIEAGQSADINIDFNACASIVAQGNNRFRLNPTLHAGEVGRTQFSISGRVVDSAGGAIGGGAALVAAEQRDAQGFDRVIMQTRADANGNFTFCPLPEGSYDIVATALSGSGVTYNPTIAFQVPVGTALGNIPLVPETGPSTAPATLTGTVTTSTGSAPTSADIALSALQTATPAGASPVDVTIPLLDNLTPNVATAPGTCPAGTSCATYTLFVPASNPSVGTFSPSGITYAPPASGAVNYKVNARASVPLSGGTPNCSPAELTTNQDAAGSPLAVAPGATTTVQRLNFTACQPGF